MLSPANSHFRSTNANTEIAIDIDIAQDIIAADTRSETPQINQSGTRAQLKSQIRPSDYSMDKQCDAPYALINTPIHGDANIEDIEAQSQISPVPVANTAEVKKLYTHMAAKSCTLDALKASASGILNGCYIASKSEGLNLKSLNDHVGILHLSCQHEGVTIVEKLAVIKDKFLVDGQLTEGYFIKGYGNRLISLSELEEIQTELNEGKKADTESPMETNFRSFLKVYSEKSPLCARRTKTESASPVLPVPPNAMSMPRCSNWANAENYIAHGFGPKQKSSDGTKDSCYHLGYTDYNPIENRMMIFLTDPKMHDQDHPMQDKDGKTIPASVNIEGTVLAEIQGIKNIEIMGPAGQIPGVKLGRTKAIFCAQEGNKTLRITTEDGAIHQLEYTDKGINMKQLQPVPSGSDIMAENVHADVNVYGYQGRNTGVYGNISGYANPELTLSTGERLLAGPLHSNRSGFDGHIRQLGSVMAHCITLTPTMGATTSSINTAINTTLRAACVAAVVYGLNAAINAARDPKTHTLFGGERSFSASGAGSVTSDQLAFVVGLTVIAQTACTAVLNFAYDNLLKDSLKSKETTRGQFLNEALMPFASEFMRLLINYGLQSSLGLPRGNSYDVAALTGNAAVNAAVNFARGRSGDSANHPAQDIIYKTTEFLFGDLLFRSLGSVAGDPQQKGPIRSIDYLEALATRAGTRGVDKLLLPIILTGLSAAGMIGPNAGAYEDQITLENRHNGVIAYLRALSVDITTLLSKKMEGMSDHVKNNIEVLGACFHQTEVMIENTNKYINRTGINYIAAEEEELEATQKAASFADMDTEGKKAYYDDLTTKFNTMVETLSVANNTSQLPESMAEGIKALMKSFREEYTTASEINYPSRPSPDFLGATLPYNTKASTVLGQKTARIAQDITTFSAAPARHIKDVHDTMAAAKGMPEKPEDSRENFRILTPKLLRGIRDSVVKYTEESGPFHYLLRWNETGQDHHMEVAPGIHLRVAMMNKRGNTSGSPDAQISGMDPLLINLGALHAEPFPAIVQRAVVTDAAYLPENPENKPGTISENERISLTEILSATSAETLAASFLAALGYGAAANNRNQRIVIKQDTAINIAQYTELMQAESISMPGAIFIVKKINPDPAPPGDAKDDDENLGQVVYMERLNTYEPEKNYRAYRRVMETNNATEKDKEIFDNLEDGALCIHPDTGHFYHYDKQSQKMIFEVASKNYFLGRDIETDEKIPARWRHPFNSPSSAAEIRRTIRASILMGDEMAGFMNDAVRNIHHEADKRAGGYYDKDEFGQFISPDKLEDDQRLQAIRDQAQPAITAISKLTMSDKFASGEIEKGKPFPGQLLANLFSTALAKPLMFLAVDDEGELQMAPDETGKSNPVQLAYMKKTHDHLEMQWDKAEAPMIGVGVNGYYAIKHENGKFIAKLIKVSEEGLTPGNLLHAIAFRGYSAENEHRYKESNRVITSATAPSDARLPWLRGNDTVNLDMTKLLEKMKAFAASEYLPIQQWFGEKYMELHPQATPLPSEDMQLSERIAELFQEIEEEEEKSPH